MRRTRAGPSQPAGFWIHHKTPYTILGPLESDAARMLDGSSTAENQEKNETCELEPLLNCSKRLRFKVLCTPQSADGAFLEWEMYSQRPCPESISTWICVVCYVTIGAYVGGACPNKVPIAILDAGKS